MTWEKFIDLLGATNVIWVPAEIIRQAGLTEFALPLFRRLGGPRSRLMHVSNERAVAFGLTVTDPRETIHDVRCWLKEATLTPALSTQREAELINAARLSLG
jgi:hypothetical protein